MEHKIVKESIPVFSLEEFMKSITYPPQCMTTNLARKVITERGNYENIPDREAEILKYALELLPIGIRENDLLAGNYGPEFAQGELIAKIREADEEEYACSEEYKVHSEEEYVISGRYLLFGIYTPSHTCIDYEAIIRKGLRDYERRMDERLGQACDTYGAQYLRAMKKCIHLIRGYAGRFKKIAEDKLGQGIGEKRKTELARMIHALERVPYEPAKDFYEALQSMWIMHTVVPTAERSWASVSLGRMDQYLLEYYRKWLADGHTKEEAKELLRAFFHLLDSYGDGSCALNLGPEYNEMTELLLEVEKEVKLRSPIIAARMSEDSDAFYDQLIDQKLFQIGQPTFYGEKSCKAAMEYRGMIKEQDYSVNSCMGMVAVGKEVADMWGCCVNMNLTLELAVNQGKPLSGELPPSLQRYIEPIKPRAPKTMEDIKSAYEEYTNAIVGYVTDQNMRKSAWTAWNRPNPVLSMLLEDCIAFGRDRAHAALHALGRGAEEQLGIRGEELSDIRKGRGAKYHNVTVLAMGFAHAADAMSAIEKLVFKEHRYTLDELICAARHNYEKTEQDLTIYADLRRCPKYADGSDEADDYAAYVLDCLADACENHYRGNIRFLPTCHTIDSNVQFGRCVYASLDGRKDGEAFGKNAGPVLQVIKNTPTDLIVSALRIPQYRFSGGVPIDIYVPENVLAKPEGREKFKGLLKSYLCRGGMQVQVNSVSLELLKKAYESPEEYPHVIVRKGGFSIYFVDMLREVQKDMIRRFEKEVG